VRLSWAVPSLWVCIAGGIGGLVNAVTSSNGFLLPVPDRHVVGAAARFGTISLEETVSVRPAELWARVYR
jgi:hypothetical protein